LLLSVALWVSGSRAAGAEEAKKLVVRSWNLCDYKSDLDGQWEGSTVASDGNCYFASSTHSGRTGAMFSKFDPQAQKITVLAEDISKVCGEDPTKDAPQGKIHSDVAELDGWLYFGTHRSYGSPQRPYQGAHLIGYEMKTGKFRDFGVLQAGFTNYAGITADPKNKCVYAYLVWPHDRSDKPCPLYRVDVKSGKKEQVAELPAGGHHAAVYYMYCDRDGNLWLPAPDGVLARFDGEQRKLELIPDALPTKSSKPSEQWYWARPIAGENRAAVTTNHAGSNEGATKLSIFDPAAKENRFKVVADTGQTYLGVAIAGNVVYFIQNEDGKTQGNAPKRLKAVNIAAAIPSVTDYGEITDQDGRKPWRIPALAADTKGGVYMTGSWSVQANDTRTTRLNQDREGNETYPPQDRCERFAYVKVIPP
jgi:hypothetical protein